MEKVTIIPGDGIGTEVMDATLKILEAAGAPLEWEKIEAGEKVIEKEVESPYTYETTPVKKRIKDVTVSIYDKSNLQNTTLILFDLRNENPDMAYLAYEDAYIEYNGKKYASVIEGNGRWADTLPNNVEWKDMSMVFEKLPDDAKQLKIVIPVAVGAFGAGGQYTENRDDMVFYVKF